MSNGPEKGRKKARYVDQQWWYRALIIVCFAGGILNLIWGKQHGRWRSPYSAFIAGGALLAFTIFAHRMRALERNRKKEDERK